MDDFLAYVYLWIVIAQALILRRLSKCADYKVLRVPLIATGFVVLAFFLLNASRQLLLVAPFFCCKRALASISYDDCEPLSWPVASG